MSDMDSVQNRTRGKRGGSPYPERGVSPFSPVTVAVAGNPNTGKTTLFNTLTGLRQKVGNYPGCTVEKKVGFLKTDGEPLKLIDLPGTYSLSAGSRDEMVVTDLLFGEFDETVDVVLVVADASSLYRNLYLASQLAEAGLPMVMALNMADVAESRGIRVDPDKLQETLGFPVVPTNGKTGKGLDRLKGEILRAAREKKPAPSPGLLPEWKTACEETAAVLNGGRHSTWIELYRGMVDDGGYAEERLRARHPGEADRRLGELRERFRNGNELIETETRARYEWVGRVFRDAVTLPQQEKETWSDRVDRVLTHKVVGTAILVGVLTLVFQALFTWAGPLMEGIDAGVGMAGEWVGGMIPEGVLHSLVVDGIIGGVGAVVVFLPQILILFFFLALLEDCGYMARAAFLMDKLFAKCGLSGRSLLPLMSSFACAIPGIMAARTIENRKDRLTTILVAPLMSCSARLPVYVVLIAAFIPAKTVGGFLGLQGLTLFGMYCVGVLTAVPVAWILKKTLLRGETPPFLLELPSYKVPSLRTVYIRVTTSGKAFLKRAGTIIFAMAVVIWGLAYFPRPESVALEHEALRESARTELSEGALEQRLAEIDRAEEGAYLRQSFIGRMGQWIEPAVRPLGWDWKIGMSVIASFPAREVIIATLGTIYNLGPDEDEESDTLRNALRGSTWPDGRKVFNVPVALSIMVFFALCMQCMATLATMRQETGTWSWPVLTFVYMTSLAYVGAFVTYQGGMLLGWGGA